MATDETPGAGGAPLHQPWDALEAPRFTGPRTYARLPVRQGSGRRRRGRVRAALGRRHVVPLGRAVRAGGGAVGLGDDPHLQPRAPRCRCSARCRRSTTATRPRLPGYMSRDAGADGATSCGRSPNRRRCPVGIGGDHSVTLAELRALAKVHGPLGLVHLDSHTDLWDAYNGLPYAHGTMFRRAIEEGILDPARDDPGSACADRCTARTTRRFPATLGVETIGWLELAEMGAGRARWSASGRGSATARRSARSTSTSSTRRSARAPARPRWAARRASRRCRSTGPSRRIPFVGYDVVEVAPQYDGPGQVTALLASMVVFEALSQIALRQRTKSD